MYKEDLIYSLDPATWAEEMFGIALDGWQRTFLQTQKRQVVLNIHRQGGKSQTASLKALHTAVYKPKSLVLMISRAERQSGELYRKFAGYYDRLPDKSVMVEDRSLDCELANGSRVVALPGVEESIRSYSAVTLIIEDEASRVPDDLNVALRPMLAISNGSMYLMSTPNGQVGHFYKTWVDDNPAWLKLKVTADQCPRISKEFLDEERRNMLDVKFRQEYLCEFTESEGAVFSSELFQSLVDSSIEPLPFSII